MKRELVNRETLVRLLQEGLEYPEGRHRLWFARCFEITVGEDRTVQLDEYESVSTELSVSKEVKNFSRRAQDRQMFHVGRSVLDLGRGGVREEQGAGWRA
ncbi:MAG: hypothetical protein COV76_06185 [Candidatus Omnitrophica bacterium CG11_big_fil_rev_8_21_14_0_20_64_10]|nr:MAG: hypothetical protein COV76_06185 [Candidatus Omnitrophica bacterium CG11_big_fil_rev_8_21_14_0_20_64_10]